MFLSQKDWPEESIVQSSCSLTRVWWKLNSFSSQFSSNFEWSIIFQKKMICFLLLLTLASTTWSAPSPSQGFMDKKTNFMGWWRFGTIIITIILMIIIILIIIPIILTISIILSIIIITIIIIIQVVKEQVSTPWISLQSSLPRRLKLLPQSVIMTIIMAAVKLSLPLSWLYSYPPSLDIWACAVCPFQT